MPSIRRHAVITALAVLSGSACSSRGEPLIEPHLAAQCREAAAAAPATHAGRADSLFRLVPEATLNAEQASLVASARHEEWTARVVVGRIAPGADSLLQPGRAVTLVVSPTLSFVAVGTQADHRASGEIFWTGALQGQQGGSAILLTSLGVTGDVRSMPAAGPYSIYTFRPIGGGLHAISCIDPTLVPIG